MKRRIGLIQACTMGMFLSGAASVATDALAQTAIPAEPVPYWWFHGTIEAGGRFFLNNPPRSGSAYLNQQSLAKYYEYSTNKPGAFSNIDIATGSRDGLYQIELGGTNIGYSDQRYYLNTSKAGQLYFNVGWDETPHVYSTSAQTPYLGVGTSQLTLPAGVVATGQMTAARLTPYLNQTDIGIKRETVSTDARWTPGDAWDIKADYSHLRRTGTQVDGIVGISGQTGDGGGTQVPKPVKDSTQNYAVDGEYAGSTAWGKFTVKTGYQGSQYTNDYQSYTIQNAYCPTLPCPANESQFARMSLWPSNQANGFTGTLAADLPAKSRYVGTATYTMMRQNSDFQPMSAGHAYTLPAASLNGGINSTLINNVVTTQISSDLKSKVTYRYYDYHNNTPINQFTSWYAQDLSTTTSANANIRTLLQDYTKQNIGAQLNWRPAHAWNLNAEYGYERYDYGSTAADTDNTTENSAKLSADWKPSSWATLRTSGSFSVRRSGNYDHLSQATFQFPGFTLPNSVTYLPNEREFVLANRQRTKANVYFDIVVLPGVTITPNYKYQDDDYGLDPNSQLGLNASRIQSGGIDLGYVPNRNLSFVFAYLHEHIDQSTYGYSSPGSVFGASTRYPIGLSAKDTADTFSFSSRYMAIPDKLELNLRYTLSKTDDETVLLIKPTTNGGGAITCSSGSGSTAGGGSTPCGGQWAPITTWNQRLDAAAVYKFDSATVAQMGWKGDIKAKLRYTWERNSVSSWQNDSIAPYSQYNTGQSVIWLAGNNPNYNVHRLGASIVASW